MSGKIKAKDLSYDKSLPPFLQRLHAQNAGWSDADRQERAIARPKRAKDAEEEDGPTIIDDKGETLSKVQVEELSKSEEPFQNGDASDVQVAKNVTKPVEPQISNVAMGRKRKAAKIIGTGDNEEQNSNDTKASEQDRVVAKKPPKKKAKPIKLAFDNATEG